MILPWIELRETPDRGLGLYAVQPIALGTATMVECAACDRISAQDAELSPRRDFILSHAPVTAGTYPDFLVPCDERVYYGNHSCDANTLDTQLGFDVAVRDIEAGEELTVDYRRFFDPTIAFRCRCGSALCCGDVRCVPPSAAVAAMWHRRIAAALRTDVPQPLLPESAERRRSPDRYATRGTYRQTPG